MSFTVQCETNNATVMGICCSQAQAQYSVSVVASTSAIGPGPGWTSLSTCTWNATSNSTGWSEAYAWMNCTMPYSNANLTGNTGCGVSPVTTSRGVATMGHGKWIGGLMLAGMIVQTILAL